MEKPRRCMDWASTSLEQRNQNTVGAWRLRALAIDLVSDHITSPEE